jgi:hypothetical protein
MVALVKTTQIQEPSSATVNMALDISGGVTVGQNLTTAGSITASSGNITASAGTVNMASSFLRNRIINGNMAVDQRNAAASQTITAAAALAYTVDRWYAYSTGANVTGQQVQGATANQYRYQFTGAASVTAIGFGQRIEALNCADLAGTTATLSVVLSNSLLTTVTWTAYYANTTNTFGSLASPTVTQISTGTFTVTSTATTYSTNITIPAAATTGIQILFTVGAQISGTWVIGNVQLEPGTVATPFERPLYSKQLADCQRYYQMSYDIGTAPGTATTTGLFMFGFAINGINTGAGSIPFKVPMRTAPTISYWDGAGNASKVTNGSPTPSTNNVAPTAAPTMISTNWFVHPGQGTTGSTYNWLQYAALAEL